MTCISTGVYPSAGRGWTAYVKRCLTLSVTFGLGIGFNPVQSVNTNQVSSGILRYSQVSSSSVLDVCVVFACIIFLNNFLCLFCLYPCVKDLFLK